MMRLADGWSFRLKLAVGMVALFVVLTGALAGCSLYWFRALHLESVGKQNQVLVESAAQMIDTKLAIARNALVKAGTLVTPDLFRDADRAQRFLDGRIELSAIFDGALFLVSNEGRIVAESPFIPNGRGRDISYREFFQIPTATGKPYISKPYKSKHSGDRPAVIIVVPVTDPAGKMIGRLHGSFELLGNNFLADLAQRRIGRSGYFSLITKDRTVIMHPDKARILGPAAPPGTNRMVDRALAGDFGYGETRNLDGVRLMSAYFGLEMTPWVIGANIPISELEAPIRAALPVYYLSVGLAGIATMFVAMFLMQRFTRPLEDMARAVSEFPADASAGSRLSRAGGGEVARLADAFNGLLAKLEAHRGELEESRERFQKVFDESPMMTVINDVETSRLVAVNKAYERFTGLTAAEAVGRTPEESGAVIEVAKNAELREKVLAGGAIDGAEVLLTREGRPDVDFLLFSRVITMQGKPHALSVLLDVTALRAAEHEKEKLQAQLVQSQKLEAIGHLAGGVAHDFNNIITGIIGHAYIAGKHVAADGPGAKALETIELLSRKAAQLNQSLLAFSRKQVLDVKPVEVDEIVRRSLTLLSRLIGEDIDFSIDLGAGAGVVVLADSLQIEQVVMNMVVNARDAMPKGGRLSVKTSVEIVDAGMARRNGAEQAGPYACISVTDTGVGMTRETLEHIFDPFFTTKEVGKGTGLGLAMAFGIVRQHKGFITVYSEPGIGTSFRIFLPLDEGRGAEPAAGAGAPEAQVAGTETVLVAEDDPVVRELEVDALREAGYRVIEARDGDEAIARFAENRGAVDLVVLDVIMPKKTGKAAFDAIRLMDAKVRVLFLSGYADSHIREKAELGDNAELLFKPLSPTEFLRKVREVLDRGDHVC